MSKLTITLEFDSIDVVRVDFVQKAIYALLDEKEDIDKNDITLHWENHNIYVKKTKSKDSYKVHFGEPK